MPIPDHSTPEANVGNPIDAIADLLIGDDSTGADEKPDPEQTPETLEPEDTNDAEELSEESTEGNEVDESELEADEADTEEAQAKTPEEEESLAQMLGIEESQLSVLDDGSFMINTKIDGEAGQIPLADVVKISQTEGSLTNRSKAMAEERKSFEAAVAAKATEIQSVLQRNQNLAGLLEQELMSEFEAVDWDNLRQFDPAEWAAKRQEMATKYQRVRTAKELISEEMTEQQAEQTEEQKARTAKFLSKQWDTMIVNNPTWSDKTTYEKDMGAMRDFAHEAYGFSSEDFATVRDARIIEMVKDAMAYRKGAKAGKKKIVPVPKVQKRGGVRKAQKVSKLDKLTTAARKARGSDKRKLQTDAVAELLMGT